MHVWCTCVCMCIRMVACAYGGICACSCVGVCACVHTCGRRWWCRRETAGEPWREQQRTSLTGPGPGPHSSGHVLRGWKSSTAQKRSPEPAIAPCPSRELSEDPNPTCPARREPERRRHNVQTGRDGVLGRRKLRRAASQHACLPRDVGAGPSAAAARPVSGGCGPHCDGQGHHCPFIKKIVTHVLAKIQASCPETAL